MQNESSQIGQQEREGYLVDELHIVGAAEPQRALSSRGRNRRAASCPRKEGSGGRHLLLSLSAIPGESRRPRAPPSRDDDARLDLVLSRRPWPIWPPPDLLLDLKDKVRGGGGGEGGGFHGGGGGKGGGQERGRRRSPKATTRMRGT